MYRTTALSLLFAALVAAQNRVSTVSAPGGSSYNAANCPNGQLTYQHRDQFWCCPGAVYGTDNDNDDGAYCCVGAQFDVPTASFASCFPFCTGTDNGVTVSSTTSQSCSATVYLTDSQYNSKVSSAASGIPSLSGVMAGTTSGGGSQPTGGSSSSSDGAGAMVTSGPMLGAVMVAGGLLLAA